MCKCSWLTGKFYLRLCTVIQACRCILLALTQLTETDPNLDAQFMKLIICPLSYTLPPMF